MVLALLAVSPAIVAQEEPLDVEYHEIPHHRWLPHSYFDQAIDSIRAQNDDVVFLARRRVGLIGDVSYSLLCYVIAADTDVARVTGAVTLRGQAWRFDVEVPRSEFGDALLKLVEQLSRRPSGI